MTETSPLATAVTNIAALTHSILDPAAPKCDWRDNRRKLMDGLSELLTAALPGVNYAAFHYRSRALPEGRYSPFTCSKQTLDKVDTWIKSPGRINKREWTRIFLDSLLASYLYILGRDVSFSENCILTAEQEAGREPENSKSLLRTIFDPVILHVCFLPSDTRDRKETGASDAANAIRLDPAAFALLTTAGDNYVDGLASRIWSAVSQVICDKKKMPVQVAPGKMRTRRWDEAVLTRIADFRRVSHYLEYVDPAARSYSASHAFSELQKRGLELAHYSLGHSSRESELDKLVKNAIDLRVLPALDRGDNAWGFLRIVQAACIFTPLLGKVLVVRPFFTYCCDPKSVPAVANLMSHLGGDASWEEKKKRMEDKDRSWRTSNPSDDGEARWDTCSALTIYGNDELSLTYAHIDDLILALQVLSAGISASLMQKEPDLHGLEGDGSIVPLGDLDDKAQSWSTLGRVAADALRGVTHEAKRQGFNIAIGTELEFREALTHLYSVDEEEEPLQADEKGNFTMGLRMFVRRNFSFLDSAYRFICVNVGPGQKLRPYSIADLKPMFHRKTTSETARVVVSRSGLTYARVDPSGRAYVITRDSSVKAATAFRCDPSGHWNKSSEENGAPEEARLLDDVQKELINGTDRSWKRFVGEILIPTVEVVSEDPLAGAVIVVLDSLRGIGNHYFKLPEGRIRLNSEPEDNCEYVGRETFKSMLVQDGATVIERDTLKILQRVQLTGGMPERKFTEWLDHKSLNPYTKRRACEWGTRHISALHFVASVRPAGEGRDVFVLVISQDGDIHYMRNKPSEWCRPVVPN